MIVNLLNIRFKQFYREILRIGFLRIIVLLGISFMLLVFLYLQTSKFPNAMYVSMISLLLILMLHTKREDKLFLKINFSSHNWIYFAEYLLISIVLLIFLLIHNFWNIALLTIAVLGIITQLDLKKNRTSYNTRIQRWIPDECFEWKSGARNLFPIIVIIWLIGVSFSFFVGSVPFAIFILGIISLNFLEKGEPYQMIIAFEKDPNKFLSLKIKQQLAILTIISTPMIISFQFFHFNLWYVPFIVYIVFCILQVYAILVKYSFYEPNSKSAAAQVFIGIGFVSFMLPVFAPLIILLSLRFYLKAKQNLSQYLNDYY